MDTQTGRDNTTVIRVLGTDAECLEAVRREIVRADGVNRPLAAAVHAVLIEAGRLPPEEPLKREA